MEIKDLERSLAEYYGKHNSPNVQNTSMQYIENTYLVDAYKALLQEIMKTHPFNYGFPDVSAVEKASEYYFLKNNQKSLRKAKPSGNEWAYKYIPLTDEEREEAEPMHDKFLEFTKKMVSKSTDKKLCKDCIHFSKDKKGYECRGCIDFSKFSQQEIT